MPSLSLLLTLIFGICVLAQIAFWLLFWLVVKVRIADRALTVDDAPGFSFLVSRWPHEEMRAYQRSLGDEERKRWINRFLCHANAIVSWSMGAFVVLLIATLVLDGGAGPHA